MTIGDRIRARRAELQWSQRDLAARLGYKDHTTITRIEAGKVELSQSRIAQIADVLGITPAALMGWDQPPEDLGALAAKVLRDPALRQLVSDYLELKDDDRALICGTAASLKTKKD